MKIYNGLYNRLSHRENLFLAYLKARKGKTKKPYVKKFEEKFVHNIDLLHKELKNQNYKPTTLKKFVIKDPKVRVIHKSNFRDRVVHHAVVNILEPIFEPIFIYDSYASRKNKGHHKALERFDYFKRKVSKNNTKICYVLKADIKHYFQEVNHEILLKIIKKKIRDDNVIWLIERILNNHKNFCRVQETLDHYLNKKGMPLGNLTSQFFANVYLNELDYFIKHKLKSKYYIRYVDDFVILNDSKLQLEKWKHAINNFLKEKLKLELHPDKSKIIKLKNGVSFLGFNVFYYHKLLKRSNIRQAKRNIKHLNFLLTPNKISKKTIYKTLNGWIAHAKHGNTYNFRNKIIDSFKNSPIFFYSDKKKKIEYFRFFKFIN